MKYSSRRAALQMNSFPESKKTLLMIASFAINLYLVTWFVSTECGKQGLKFFGGFVSFSCLKQIFTCGIFSLAGFCFSFVKCFLSCVF